MIVLIFYKSFHGATNDVVMVSPYIIQLIIRMGFIMRQCINMHFINTLRPRQNGRHFTDDTFKHIFLNENVRISIKISLKFVPKGPINNNGLAPTRR